MFMPKNGCRKFDLPELCQIAEHCIPYIGDGQELLSVKPTFAPLGNSRQLWSVATKIYFSDKSDQLKMSWL